MPGSSGIYQKGRVKEVRQQDRRDCMDRQCYGEAAGEFSDEQLRSALAVIKASYEGEPADRLFRQAVACFDCLIEISGNTSAIADFARRHDTDNKYLVDGANSVISRMLFNPEENYYTTLGLSPSSSPDEIRERWKKLMLLYHPDRQGGDESWVTERAKKVNEAYSVLKDSDKRHAFDRRLHELAAVRMTSYGPASARTSFRTSGRASRYPEWDKGKKKIPVFLVGLYLSAAVIILGYIYMQNKSEHLEKALTGG